MVLAFGMPSLRNHFAATALLIVSSNTQSRAFSSQFSFKASSNFNNNNRIATHSFLLPRGGSGGGTLLFSTTTTTTTSTMPTASEAAGPKLEALRASLAEKNLDVYLIPSDDPHLSEYTPDAYKRRAFLTGFSGSAGTAVVTKDEALLWTDSRYFNEANLQLDDKYWKLMKDGQPNVSTITKYLTDLATDHFTDTGKPLRVGMDPYVHPATFAKDLHDAFVMVAASDKPIGEIDTSNSNLIDPIWGKDRPPIPTSPFRIHPLEYAGMSISDKITKVRQEMETKKATLAIFCTLDDVAYLLNVRAMGDVETCPVGIAYATVGQDEVTLYCDLIKVESKEMKEHLKDIIVKPYGDIVGDIQAHAQNPEHKVWMDKSRANFALSSIVPEQSLVDSQNAITPMKACKNEAELEGMRKAHIVDGAAMAKFMAWLQEAIVDQGRTVSEVEIDLKLTGYRAEQPGFLEPSFPTIAGVGPNGAIIHYRAKEDTDLLKYLDLENPILIDSGGQYLYGTTDVTRTWHFGIPTPEFVNYFTRVLKGNIGVDSMVFPENTPGFVLDVFARKALWEAGVDYGHGTGHGVGAALNVHEGPHSISPKWTNKEGLKKGMVVSNEPGYYEDGNFGIRIENLLEISFVKPEHNNEANGIEHSKSSKKKFLKFDKLTMIPIQKNLIDINLMTDAELDWLDSYHQMIMEKVGPLLEAGSPAMQWLEASCSPIQRK